MSQLDRQACLQLAEALGDMPQTTISVHLLQRGLCRAFTVGDPGQFDGAIIQDVALPGEPTAFGTDPDVIWSLLQSVPEWFCVNVSETVAQPLGEVIEKQMGVPVRYYSDIYYTLTVPAPDFANEAVRQLTPDDLVLVETAREEVRLSGFGGPRALLQDGFAAAAIVDHQMVAIAQTYARTRLHADIGVGTLPDYRQRGYATAAAALVARCGQQAGQTPVWSTGEDNFASLHVAQKLGFQEVARRVYIIPERQPEQVSG